MQFGFIGINYKNAPLDVRDKISFTESSKIDFINKASDGGIRECLVLATCYRSEVFYFFDTEEQKQYMIDLYRETFKNVDLSDILMERSGDEAIYYIFRIAAGLESAVMGEDQILGQLRDALMLSAAMGFARKEMHRVVENAMASAKAIKSKYKISEIPLSVSYIGIKEVERQTGFEGKNVLIVGSGETALLALRYITEYNVAGIVLCSRNIAHAKKVKESFPQIKIVLYDERMDQLNFADIVISATSSPHYTIFANECKYQRSITFLDLAAPRDIDPKVVEIHDSKLIDLDTLDAISRENKAERERLTEMCREDIEVSVNETLTWLSSIKVDPTIQSLHARCDEITKDSYEYLERKLDLTDREKKILKKILAASLKKLVRDPVVGLKQLDSAENQEKYTKVLGDLFNLSEDENMNKKAILVVSFGTSVEETKKKTLDAIEADIAAAFPDYKVYSAWTSRRIAQKTGHPLIEGAMKMMIEDGVKDLLVVSTHIMKAIEYETIEADIKAYSDKFDSLKIGNPLISTEGDIDWLARFLNNEYRKDVAIGENEILLFMGHGTDHEQNLIYTDVAGRLALNDFKCTDIFIATVEGKPTIYDIIKTIDGSVPEDTTFILAPLMIVAGVHAKEDLWGDEEDSWKNILTSKGYKVRPNLKGLGEYKEIRNRFIEEVKSLING